MSEYTAKALIEPRDYRVVFVIQKARGPKIRAAGFFHIKTYSGICAGAPASGNREIPFSVSLSCFRLPNIIYASLLHG